MTLFAADPRPIDSARDAAAELAGEALRHPVMQHRWLTSLLYPGRVDVAARLRQFACECHGIVAALPRCLEIAMLRLPTPTHRVPLQRRLAAELGYLGDEALDALVRAGIGRHSVHAIPRAKLFQHFAAALGVTASELAAASPAAQHWQGRMWSLLDHASPAVAFGAIAFGIEWIEATLHAPLARAVLALGTLHHDALAFLELTCRRDEAHRRELLAIANDLMAPPGQGEALAAGMRAALDLRAAFFDTLATRSAA